MTRVEECTKTINEVNEAIKEFSNRVVEPGFGVEPGEFLLASFEMAKVSMLMDIAQSLAILADELSDD